MVLLAGAPATQKLWRFTSADSAWSVLLGTDTLTIEAEWTRYTEYSAWRVRFERVWQAAVEHLGPAGVLYQGLRYIDHLERDLPGPEWATWINPDLLGAIRLSRFADSLEHALTDLRFRTHDGVLSFKHGIVALGPNNAPGYLLDFDCFTQSTPNGIDSDSILSRFDGFHDIIWRLVQMEPHRRGDPTFPGGVMQLAERTISPTWDYQSPSHLPYFTVAPALESDPTTAADLSAAVGTTAPTNWIGPNTLAIALGYFRPLRNDAFFFDPDLFVVTASDNRWVVSVNVRVPIDYPIVATAVSATFEPHHFYGVLTTRTSLLMRPPSLHHAPLVDLPQPFTLPMKSSRRSASSPRSRPR